MIWRYTVIAVGGYLLGNITMGLIVSERYHMDIRDHGSGNAGTTNVLRTLGWVPSAMTLLGDALKSFAASMLGLWLAGTPGLMVGGLMAVVGHNWPVFNGFRGGKGMAASLGMVFALNWPIALSLLVSEVVISGLTGYVSVASIINSALFPVVIAVVYRDSPDFWLYLVYAAVIAVITIFSHRANIKRLLNGTENRLNFKRIKAKPDDDTKG